MSKNILYLSNLLLLLLCGCREDIIIDVEEGNQMIGIYGCITNEFKQHQITISKSGDFYGTGAPAMVSGAEVTVTENDSATYTYKEIEPGIYEMTTPMKGKSGNIYTLHVTTHENGKAEDYYAADTMKAEVESIDSMKVMLYTFNNKKADDYYKVCPYFQTLEGAHTSYMTKVEINGKLITDTLNECRTMQLGQLAGIYLNGKELEAFYKGVDFPTGIYYINGEKDDEKIKAGDEITLYLHVISEDYLDYIKDVKSSSGSNPFFGSPANVRSNIKPEKRALGYFFTSAITKGTTIVQKKDLE